MSRSVRGRSKGVVVVAGAAALLAAAVAVVGPRVGGDESSPGDGVPAPRPLHSYRVVYQVTQLDRSHEEEVLVRRPYESRRLSRRDGVIVSGVLANPQGLWHWSAAPDNGWLLIDPTRRRAEADADPLGSLPYLLDQGLARPGGTGEAGGHPCTRFRTREPVGNRAVGQPSARDYTEVCVHRTGVLLRERWVVRGRTLRDRVATAFETAPPLDDGDFAATPGVDRPDGALADIQPVPVGEDVLRSLAVTFELPPSISADGVVGWIRTQPGGGVVGGSLRRFYRRGAEVADVEEVDTNQSPVPEGERVDTDLGDAYLESNLHHLTLRLPLDGVTVVVTTRTVAMMEDLVAAMRRQPPGR